MIFLAAADPYVRALGGVLRRERLRLRWSQGRAAERFGCGGAPHWNRFERASQKDVGLVTFVRLALALSVTPSDLMRAVEAEVLRLRGPLR